MDRLDQLQKRRSELLMSQNLNDNDLSRCLTCVDIQISQEIDKRALCRVKRDITPATVAMDPIEFEVWE